MTHYVGIDLGTTFSALAYIDERAGRLYLKSQITEMTIYCPPKLQ